jgi:hypothetical protein
VLKMTQARLLFKTIVWCTYILLWFSLIVGRGRNFAVEPNKKNDALKRSPCADLRWWGLTVVDTNCMIHSSNCHITSIYMFSGVSFSYTVKFERLCKGFNVRLCWKWHRPGFCLRPLSDVRIYESCGFP